MSIVKIHEIRNIHEIIMYIYIIAELYDNIYKVRISSNGDEQASGISSKCTQCY